MSKKKKNIDTDLENVENFEEETEQEPVNENSSYASEKEEHKTLRTVRL